MADAGVSPEVIKAYVENMQIAGREPTASDLITLKQRGISDEVTMALVKRGAELRQQTSRIVTHNPVRAGQLNRFNLDPEGYDYFQYYYLQPRTLASVYARLGPYPYLHTYYGRYPPRYRDFGAYRGLPRGFR